MTPNKFPLLATLDDDALLAFQQQATQRKVPAGEQLLVEGGKNDRLYLIASGKMEVRREHRGNVLPIGFIGGGDICGEHSLLRTGRASAAIYSIADSVLYELPGELITQQYKKNTNFKRAIDLVMERRKVNAALALNPLFSALPVDVRQSMYHVGEMVSFACGEVLVQEHDCDIERCYLLLSGKADSTIEVSGQSGKTIHTDTCSMGDQVGEITLLTHPMQIKTVTARSAITALCISNKTLHTFRMGSLDFALALHENTRLQMTRHMNLLIPIIGEAQARAATLDRMIPLALYRNPEQQMTQPFT